MNDINSPTIELTKELIARPSVTPADMDCQAILGERLQKLRFTLHHLPFGDVQNLWAILDNRNGESGALFAFAGHTDVVPPGELAHWTTPPFTPTIRGEYLYGRGAADMKGSLAAMVTATERFVRHNPNFKGAIAFLITSDEEGIATNGTVKVIETLKSQGIQIDYCLVGEPSSQHIVGDILKNGRRGSLNGTLKILGTQGHIAYPERCDNPIHRALLPLLELSNMHWDNGNEYFPPTRLQISNIKAGTGAENVIPGILECQFNFRFSTSVTADDLMARVQEVLIAHQVKYELTWRLSGLPFLTKPGALLSACIAAIQTTMRITPQLSTSGGTSDGRFIAPLGTDVIELGPCNTTIHCIDEAVKVEELNALSQIYEQILHHLFIAQ